MAIESLCCALWIEFLTSYIVVVFTQETLLLDAMFEVPGSDVKTVHINEDCVRGNSQPEYIRHDSAEATAASAAAASDASASSDGEEESAQVRVKQ